MIEATVTLVTSLVSRFPGLRGLLAKHIEGNSGEILPHVFFGDVTHYVIRCAGSGEASSELHDILGYLEEAFVRGDRDVIELVSVSFLENLPREGEAGAQVRQWLGPCLAKELRGIG